MQKLALFVGWLVVVALTTTLTWQIVGAADDRVSDRPTSPLNVAAPRLTPIAIEASNTTSVVNVTEPTAPPPPTSSTSPVAPTTTEPATNVSTTSTTAASAWSLKTVSTAGGIVVIKYRPEEILLQTATPAPGYRAEIKETGPNEVRVEFESDDQEVELRARWEDGELAIEISE